MNQPDLFDFGGYQPKKPIADHNEGTTGTRRRLVLELLSDGRWHRTAEIESAAVGGSQGTRRLRELRAVGWLIEKRKAEHSTQYEYRLRGKE